MRRGWRVVAAVGAVVVTGLGLGSCAGRADESTPSGAPAAVNAGRGPGQAAPLAAEGPRQVISTATLRVEVRDVGAATAQAGRLAGEAGGFVAGSEESGRADERRATVTLKVPSDGFDRLVGAVGALGEVRTKQIGTEDVTDQVVDLEARLRASRAAADRLQQLIARSATVAEVVGVEAELAKRTAEIESLEGRLRVLRDRVDLATVTVSFSKPQPAADDDLPSFLAGLRGGWRALRATAIVTSAVLGALLPWLVPAALVAVAARIGWRRWRRAHPPRPRPVLAPPAWAYGGAPAGAGAPPAPAPPPPPEQPPPG